MGPQRFGGATHSPAGAALRSQRGNDQQQDSFIPLRITAHRIIWVKIPTRAIIDWAILPIVSTGRDFIIPAG